MNKTNRIIARLLCVVMVVCSIAALPIVSYATGATEGTWGGVNWEITQTAGSDKYTLTLTADTPTQLPWAWNPNATGTCWDSAHGGEWAATDIDKVVFGSNVTTTGTNGVFAGYTELTTLELGDSVTTINWNSFNGCTKLATVTGGRNITAVNGQAFVGTGIYGIPESFEKITTIDSYAFQANTETVTIPATVTKMCVPFGANNTVVKTMVFEEGGQTLDMTYFNKEVNSQSTTVTATTPTLFSGLGGLEMVFLPKNIILPNRAWNVQYGTTKSNAATFVMPEGFANEAELREYAASTNGAGITVKYVADHNGTGLGTHTWSAAGITGGSYKVTELANGKYQLDLYGTGSMTYTAGATVDSVLLPNTTQQPWYNAYGENIEKLVVHSGITGIADHTFRSDGKITGAKYTSLKYVELPEGLTTLSDGCFYQVSLEKIDLPQSLTTIGAQAFASSTIKGTVVIPKNVTSIDSQAFYSCTGIEELIFECESAVTLGAKSIFHCTSLNYVQLTGKENFGTNQIFGWGNPAMTIVFKGDVPTWGNTMKLFDNDAANSTGVAGLTVVTQAGKTIPETTKNSLKMWFTDRSLPLTYKEGKANAYGYYKINASAGTADVTMWNDSSQPKTYFVILAAYNSQGMLVGADIAQGSMAAFEIDKALTALDTGVAGATRYEVFVWDGPTTIAPLERIALD